VMPDFMRIGGVTGWLRAAAIAGAAQYQLIFIQRSPLMSCGSRKPRTGLSGRIGPILFC
jgi:hypothetical protein